MLSAKVRLAPTSVSKYRYGAILDEEARSWLVDDCIANGCEPDYTRAELEQMDSSTLYLTWLRN